MRSASRKVAKEGFARNEMKSKIQKLLADALTNYENGSYVESLHQAEAMYSASPRNIDVLIMLSANHFQLCNLNESMFYAQQCIRVDVTCSEAYVALGNCIKEMGDLSSAFSFYQKAIRHNPRLSSAYSNLGLAHFMMGKPKEAIETLQIAILLDSSCDAMCNLASVYKSQGRANDAKNQLLTTIRCHPMCAIALNNLGVLFHHNGDFDQAIDCYEQALQISPKFIDSISNSGNALYSLSKKIRDADTVKKAKERFKRALELRPGFAVARGCYGTLLLESASSCKHGKRHLRMATLQDETCFDSLNNLSALYFKHGDIDDSLKLCLRVLKQRPNHWCAYINLGNVLKAKSMPQAAALSYHVALELHDKVAAPLSNIGTILIAQERELESIEHLTRSLDIDPSTISTNTNLGVANLSLGFLEKAENYLVQATKGSGSEAPYNLAVMHQRKGTMKESMRYALEAINRTRDGNNKKLILRFLDFLKLSTCDWSSGVSIMPQVSHFESFEGITRSNLLQLPPCAFEVDERLNIGYVFYHDHLDPSYKNLPQMGDPSRFKVFCYKVGAHEGEGNIAKKVIEDRIHILVFTTRLLPNQPRERLAPLQIAMHYTGYQRADIDYVVSPESYSTSSINAKTLVVPGVYFEPSSTDSYASVENDSLRAYHGISHNVFLYGCFQQPQFLDPELFDSWMKMLKSTDGTSILLMRHNEDMEINLKLRALERGIDSDRIVFVECGTAKAYLDCFSMIDLYLDSRIQSGRSAIWNALSAGTPCVCFHGSNPQTVAGAHILSSIGLNELIVHSLHQYETLGILLQSDENNFINIVKKLDNRVDDGKFVTSPTPVDWYKKFELEMKKAFATKINTKNPKSKEQTN